MPQAGPDVDLAIDLARDTLARVAPEELPLFPATSELYRADPGAVEAEAGGDDMLGFGGEVAVALAPVVLSMGGAVAKFLVEQVREAVGDESQGAIRAAVRRLFDRSGDDDGGADGAAVAALSKEQLRQVRAVALERARRLKLPADKAELLADAMVGGLAIA